MCLPGRNAGYASSFQYIACAGGYDVVLLLLAAKSARFQVRQNAIRRQSRLAPNWQIAPPPF
jgi:hypothetical protein